MKKTAKTSPPRATRRHPPLSQCTECGARMDFITGMVRERVNGESVAVEDIPHFSCRKCGNELLKLDVAQHVFETANALYRQRHHLLSGAEILAIRKQLKLTQVQLAALLKLGGNTLSRWESGRIVQSAAMDTLLRLLRDVPGTLPYLRKRARSVA